LETPRATPSDRPRHRYDADDITHPIALPAAIPNLPEPPANPEQINQSNVPFPQSVLESNQINRVDPAVEQQSLQSGEQRNGVESDAVQHGEGGAVNVEPETQGTGIKEDG
jgi:hypothetical protein